MPTETGTLNAIAQGTGFSDAAQSVKNDFAEVGQELASDSGQDGVSGKTLSNGANKVVYFVFYFGSWFWYAVLLLIFSFGFSQYGPYGACAGTSGANFEIANRSCTPGDLDPLSAASLGFLTFAGAILFLNMFVSFWAAVRPMFTDGGPASYFEPMSLANGAMFFWLISYILEMCNGYSMLTNRSRDTIEQTTINVNNTLNVPNWNTGISWSGQVSRDNQITSIFFAAFGGAVWVIWLLYYLYNYGQPVWDFYRGNNPAYKEFPTIEDDMSRDFVVFALVCFYISVACGIGGVWLYNLGSSFPQSQVAKNLLTGSVICWALGSPLVLTMWLWSSYKSWYGNGVLAWMYDRWMNW